MKSIIKGPLGDAMKRATRLTRDGRFTDAMAALTTGLEKPGAKGDAGAAGRSMPKIDPAALVGEALARVGLGSGRGDAVADTPADALPPGARFEARRFTTLAGQRSYKIYVPATHRPEEPMPLVVMLHGCTQSPDDFAAGTRMNELAEREGFLVLYPAQSSAANSSKCWNWFDRSNQERGAGEPSIIAGMVEEVASFCGIDRRRIFVAGLSAGGAQAVIMGRAYPELFAAVGVHSGLACGAAHDVASAFAAMRQGAEAGGCGPEGVRLPTIVFHGDGDKTVNPVNAKAVAEDARGHETQGSPEVRRGSTGGVSWERTRDLGPDGRAQVERWTVHGLGHAWSGGSAKGSYTAPQGPDASAEMLRFFREHARVE